VTRRRAGEPEVYRITEARRSHSDDLNKRINRYLLSMAIRTACVVLVFVVDGPLRWAFAVGAIFLPYIAVVLANATDRRRGAPGSLPVAHRGLSAGDTFPDGGARRPTERPGVVLEGHVVARGGSSDSVP
jgi:hypothetical protein